MNERYCSEYDVIGTWGGCVVVSGGRAISVLVPTYHTQVSMRDFFSFTPLDSFVLLHILPLGKYLLTYHCFRLRLMVKVYYSQYYYNYLLEELSGLMPAQWCAHIMPFH